MKLTLIRAFYDGRYYHALAEPVGWTIDGKPLYWRETGIEESEFNGGDDVEILGTFDTFDKTFTPTTEGSTNAGE